MESATPVVEQGMKATVKKLFGTRDSYFGTKKDLCEKIVNLLATCPEGRRYFPSNDDPESAVGRYQLEKLMEIADDCEFTLDDLAPVRLDESTARAVVNDARANRDLKIEGIDGVPPPDVAVAARILQLSALDAICRPPEQWSEQKIEFMKEMRQKYQISV